MLKQDQSTPCLILRRERSLITAELIHENVLVPRSIVEFSDAALLALNERARALTWPITDQPESIPGAESAHLPGTLHNKSGRETSNVYSKAEKTAQLELQNSVLQLLGSQILSSLLHLDNTEIKLIMDEVLIAVPWEMAFKHSVFGGREFRLSRQVFFDRLPIEPAGPGNEPGQKLSILIIESESVANLTSSFFDRLRKIPNANISRLAVADCSKSQLLDALMQHQIIHCTANIGNWLDSPHNSNRNSNSTDSRSPLVSPLDLQSLNRLPELIGFWPDSTNYPDDENLTADFDSSHAVTSILSSGVHNQLLLPHYLTQTESQQLSVQYYQSLAEGLDLSTALLGLTRQFQKLSVSTSLVPVFYGNPRQRLVNLGYSEKGFSGNNIFRLDARRDTRLHEKHGDSKASFEKGGRRQLTVLFCDLVGSTRLSEQIGMEGWREVLHIYYENCQRIIHNNSGYITQYLGDGLLVYFGYPTAFENSAHNAVNAALEIVGAAESMNAEAVANIESFSSDIKLQMRLAIHTGPVVVDELGRENTLEYLALGVVPAIASRLQELARPNTVVISASTYKLVQGSFNVEDLGVIPLKGISEPQRVYQAHRADRSRSRFEIARQRGLTEFVGREEEISFLVKIWEEVKRGKGHIVLINGEPGIGKSRLIEEFSDRIGRDDICRFSCRCSPNHMDSPLYPIIDLIQRQLDLQPGDSDAVRLGKIEDAAALIDIGEAVPILGSLLSVPFEHKYQNLVLSPAREKQRNYEFLHHWCVQLAGNRPIRFLVEDLHWADPSTKEFLDYLVSITQDYRFMMLVAYRSESQSPWQTNHYTEKLTLGPLPKESVERMIDNLLSDKILPPEIIQHLVTGTDGVPLFLEESILMLLSSNDKFSADPGIPSTLQDLLMARLDSLGPVKRTAQLAAIIGREFHYEILLALSEVTADEFDEHMNLLLDAGLINKVGAEGTNSFSFKHAMVRDTAYQSLSSRTARQIHKQTATILREKFPEFERMQPEIIADHLTRARVPAEAVNYWLQAGRLAILRHAHKEAISHFSNGLAVISKMAEEPARYDLELNLNTLLAGRLIAIQGYGAVQVEKIYSHSLELARKLDNLPRLLQATFGLQSFHFMRGNFQTARELANEGLELAKKIGKSLSLVKSHYALGEICFHQGNHGQCQSHLNQGIKLYNKNHHNPKSLQDPAVMSLCYYSWSQWMCGHTDQALSSVTFAMEMAEELDHPFSKSIAYSFASGLHLFRGELDLSRYFADKALKICEENDFLVWQAFAMVVNGRAEAESAHTNTGIEQIQAGIDLWTSTGAIVTKSYHYALLAEVLAIAGKFDQAHNTINQAQDIIDKTGEGYYQAEVFRIRGELDLATARAGDESREWQARDNFKRSLQVARAQQTRSFELRTAISLARLDQRSGKSPSGDSAITQSYQWFTEGFDTRDLENARTLLRA